MSERAFESEIDGVLADEIVSAVRTSVGDTLRGVVYFTPAAFDVLYVRQGLYSTREATRRAKARLVEFEERGFDEEAGRADRDDVAIGDYEFTVRVHGEGFVVRILVGERGVLFTSDEIEIGAFDDAASAVRGLLADA
jgi:hypothetical protein